MLTGRLWRRERRRVANDYELLRRALAWETRNAPRCWDAASIGATRSGINRLQGAELIEVRLRSSRVGPGEYGPTLYRMTEAGRKLAAETEERPTVPAAEIMAAMDLIVGFDDVKQQIAYSIEARKRTHFLLEGPPACCKSVLLDAIRGTVPNALMVFGSRTSGKGLSDELFEKKPSILLLDEADKMHHDVFSLTLGLMEAGEIINTKHGDTRGIKLNCMVIAACNSSRKMPPEFLSRFALHPVFQHYTRQEFLDVVRAMLARSGCPTDIAEIIAVEVFDNRLGDVRQARSVWELMQAPTREEAERVLRVKLRYTIMSQAARIAGKRQAAPLLL